MGGDFLDLWESKLVKEPTRATSEIPGYHSDLANKAALESLNFPRADLQLTACSPESLSPSSELKAALVDLADLRLGAEAAMEIKFAFPAGKNLQEVLPRAALVGAAAGPKYAWPDLLAGQTAKGLLESECGVEAYLLLYPDPFPESFTKAAAKHGLPRALLLAIARTESAFDPRARSWAGALGLTQVMPATAEKVKAGSSARLFDPELNLDLGAAYLKSLVEKFDGKWYLAIAAYNAGPAAVEKWLARYPGASPELFADLIPYAETRNYVRKVLEAAFFYSRRNAVVQKR
jgi:soluble lytic murein transglycosylase-like protein